MSFISQGGQIKLFTPFPSALGLILGQTLNSLRAAASIKPAKSHHTLHFSLKTQLCASACSLIHMRPSCLLTRRMRCIPRPAIHNIHRRNLLTLAIETSCDDTSVAVLEKIGNKSTLHFHDKVTSDNRAALGIHPVIAIESHQKSLGPLIQRALQTLPAQDPAIANWENLLPIKDDVSKETILRKRPDFVTATRGPGIYGSLQTGIDCAKGLAVAWDVPFLGVNHMQAHALTPRLVSSLIAENESTPIAPAFPFLSLLVSGGNTMLVHAKSVLTHSILAETGDTAIGNAMDKCAIHVLPPSLLESSGTVSYGPLFEKYAFPNGEADYNYQAPSTKKGTNIPNVTPYGWVVTPPLAKDRPYAMEYTYSGIRSSVTRIASERPNMDETERRLLAREAQRVAFEHVGSRALLALSTDALKDVKTLVVAGGVASNRFLKYVLRSMLDARGFEDVELCFPPVSLCTDNAAMIAWTGMEMWEEGWRSSLEVVGQRKWSIDAGKPGGGILRLNGWVRRDGVDE